MGQSLLQRYLIWECTHQVQHYQGLSFVTFRKEDLRALYQKGLQDPLWLFGVSCLNAWEREEPDYQTETTLE